METNLLKEMHRVSNRSVGIHTVAEIMKVNYYSKKDGQYEETLAKLEAR